MEVTMSQDIASAEVDVLWPDGRRGRVSLAIGQPYEDAQLHSWHCPVRLDGLFPRLPDIGGETSLQALLLALRLMHQQLAHLEARGAKLLSPGEDPADPDSGFELESYFGGLGNGSSRGHGG
jgi:hypothetical protein